MPSESPLPRAGEGQGEGTLDETVPSPNLSRSRERCRSALFRFFLHGSLLLFFALVAACKPSAVALLPADLLSPEAAPSDLRPEPPPRHRGYVALVGGGAEEEFYTPHAWSQAAYGWIVERAQHGRILILSASTETEWLPTYFQLLGARAAENLTLDRRELADDEQIAERIRSADGVFIKGGDQARYVTLWGGTRSARALAEVYARGGVLAGTSAGAHVLSQVIYDARTGSLSPAEAITDGRSPKISFSEDLVGYAPPAAGPTGETTPEQVPGLLPGTLVDTHFTARGRLARLAVLLGTRAQALPGTRLLGVGLDEKTALLVGPELVGEVVGQGAVTLMHTTAQSRIALVAGQPPTVTDLDCELVTEGFAVSLLTGQVTRRPTSARELPPAALPSPGRAARVDGSRLSDSEAGAVRLKDVRSEPRALRYGTLELVPGRGDVAASLLVTLAFAGSDYTENRVGGLLWGLATASSAARLGVLIDEGESIRATADGLITVEGEGGGLPGSAVLIVDSRAATRTDRSTYVVDAQVSHEPRQSVALDRLRVHLLPSGSTFRATTGEITLP